MIKLKNVTFSYNGRQQNALNDLTLEIPSGAITALLGPNGSGKTTLLRLVLGQLAPQQGRIEFANQKQHPLSQHHHRSRIGLVAQDETISFDFTVLEYTLLGRAPHLRMFETPGSEDYAIAEQALKQAGVSELSARALHALSGGERQLVMIARALAQQPRILLLDEPTSHLDLGNKKQVLVLLKTLTQQGMTILFTTHEPNLAALLADHTILIRDGHLMDTGTTKSVLTEENLSQTYGVMVNVIDLAGKRVILPSPIYENRP